MVSIASVDPGQTTGLVIAHMNVDHSVHLKKRVLGSFPDVVPVATEIALCECDYIVMERRAEQGTRVGGEPYERLLALLVDSMGYGSQHSLLFASKTINLISPGLWKPVMKGRKFEYGKWAAATTHEHDALKLLYYSILLNYPNKEIHHG